MKRVSPLNKTPGHPGAQMKADRAWCVSGRMDHRDLPTTNRDCVAIGQRTYLAWWYARLSRSCLNVIDTHRHLNTVLKHCVQSLQTNGPTSSHLRWYVPTRVVKVPVREDCTCNAHIQCRSNLQDARDVPARVHCHCRPRGTVGDQISVIGHLSSELKHHCLHWIPSRIDS